MNIHALRSVCIGALLTAGVCAIAAACGSNNSPGSDSGTGGSGGSGGTAAAGGGGSGGTGGTSTAGTGGSGGTSTAGSGGSGGTGGTVVGDGGSGDAGGGIGDSGLAVCPDGLKDKTTTCTAGTTPSCSDPCGPDLPAGSAQKSLGTKTCSCPSGVYTCLDCVYETPPPACYTVTGTPPACTGTVGNGLACTTQCVDGTPGPCTISVDAGTGVAAKSDGCVCIMSSSGLTWACATEWWM
jgi:hypothetical protein